MNEKLIPLINKVKEFISKGLTKSKELISGFFNNYVKKMNPVVLSIIIFALLFLLDIFALRYLTNTGYVVGCILLVIETVLAVLLSSTNYGILGIIAIAELIVGILAKQIPTTLLSLVIYFLALVVIHIMRSNGGKKH